MNETRNLDAIYVRSDAGGETLIIDPGTTLQQLMTFERTPALLIDSMQGWTTWQKRNSLSVLTAIRSPGQTAPLTAAMLVSGLRVVADGEESNLSEFMQRSDRSRVPLDEICIPLSSDCCFGMAAVNATPTDTPIVSAFAAIELKGEQVVQARIALTGVWRKAAQLVNSADALVGKLLTEEAIAAVASAVAKEVSPRGNYVGSEAYRRAMAGITARRALSACLKGAQTS
ncbi:MAG: hypothetical protein JXA97_11330 [Anaerolineales bacterium]|nr:hypothetical protein [Anaerolineales bacterium]